ncbi:DUF4294 domain-containing protein [Pollutibacter soli]|uniref:DUF4294 domain-containing protein n=1 Tax=Pollutibacter soli TaxID=3034157 RepID=UPI0030133892
MQIGAWKHTMSTLTCVLMFLFIGSSSFAQETSSGRNDTLSVPIIIVGQDTMTYAELQGVYVWGKMTPEQREKYRKWTRLRNAVYVTYPYARKASLIFIDINEHLANIPDPKQRKAYIRSREKELKKEFGDPLTKLSVYQGKILMKLINRQTKNTCYEIIREYKGGASAQFWQSIAWLFGSSLKQHYNPNDEDAEMEPIVQEVMRMYHDS